MSMEFLAPLAPIQEPSLSALQPAGGADPRVAGAATAGGTSFGAMVSSGLDSVSEQLTASQVDLQQLATGNVENLHQVMIKLEESRISFQLMLQVRNRALESYQELMRMQV